jgi:hypothetical protein
VVSLESGEYFNLRALEFEDCRMRLLEATRQSSWYRQWIVREYRCRVRVRVTEAAVTKPSARGPST